MTSYLNHLHLGNCIPLMQSLPENSVDLILTDPPYLVNYRDRTGRKIAGDINGDWLNPAFAEMYRVMRHNRFAVSFYYFPSSKNMIYIPRTLFI